MTQANPSRADLASVISALDKAPLKERQKQDLRSAVRTVARLLGRRPEDVPSDPMRLRPLLDGISAQSAGLSLGRWANIRSLLGKALAITRPMLPGRVVEPLKPEWEVLIEGLDRNRRIRLLPLLRWLGGKDVLPGTVSLSDLQAYERHLQEDSLRKEPVKTWDSLVWCWNACVSDRADWPQVSIPRESRKESYILGWEVFPASLKFDVDGYLRRLSAMDLDGDGPNRPARPATLMKREYEMRIAASILVRLGEVPGALTSLAAIANLEAARKILRFLLDRKADGKSTSQIHSMAGLLKALATHWVKLEGTQLEEMRKLAARLALPRTGMTAKNRQRLRPFDDKETVAAFLSLPQRLRADVEQRLRKGRLTKPMLIQGQVAAAIALLQAVPLRSKNLSELKLSENLLTRSGRRYLVIRPEAVKNDRPIEFELPAHTNGIVDWYLTEIRPHLLNGPNDALFPGTKGGAKAQGTLAGQISKAMERWLGIPFNVHLFRHAGGKIFLDLRPGEYEVVRQILGHKSLATTIAAYTGEETKAAGRYFAQVINEMEPAKPGMLKRGARP